MWLIIVLVIVFIIVVAWMFQSHNATYHAGQQPQHHACDRCGAPAGKCGCPDADASQQHASHASQNRDCNQCGMPKAQCGCPNKPVKAPNAKGCAFC